MGLTENSNFFAGYANIKSTVKIYHTDHKIQQNLPQNVT